MNLNQAIRKSRFSLLFKLFWLQIESNLTNSIVANAIITFKYIVRFYLLNQKCKFINKLIRKNCWKKLQNYNFRLFYSYMNWAIFRIWVLQFKLIQVFEGSFKSLSDIQNFTSIDFIKYHNYTILYRKYNIANI